MTGEELVPEMVSRIIITSLNEEVSEVFKEHITRRLIGEECVLRIVLRIIITSLNKEVSTVVR